MTFVADGERLKFQGEEVTREESEVVFAGQNKEGQSLSVEGPRQYTSQPSCVQ